MLGIGSRSRLEGWVACVAQGERAALALVQTGSQGRPAVRWALTADWTAPALTLHRLRRSHALHRYRRVALLQRRQYSCVTLDAPADLPRQDWAASSRWQIKDSVDFAVDSAAIDVLAIPPGASHRSQPQLIAVASPEHAYRPVVDAGADAGLPWQALDIGETALRNLSGLDHPPDRSQALLHCDRDHAALVVTFGGELLVSRQLELSAAALGSGDVEQRQEAWNQLGVELQRSLDGVERAFGQTSMNRLLVTPMADRDALIEFLRTLLYVPVQGLALHDLIDLDAVPELAADPAQLNRHLYAIGAALRPD